jgi:hypothetical protein
MIQARTITHDLLTRSKYRARIHAHFIDNVKMDEKKMFANTT